MEVRTDDQLEVSNTLEANTTPAANTRLHTITEPESKMGKHTSMTLRPGSVDFPLFQTLPTELRLMIWEQAIAEELKSRRIALYETRLIPLKQHNSALLSVSKESRVCARKVYNLSLTVYRVPWPEPNPATYNNSYESFQGIKESDESDEESLFIRDIYSPIFRRPTSALIDTIEARGRREGIIHISPAYDQLILTGSFDNFGLDWEYEEEWDILEPFWVEAANKFKKEVKGTGSTRCDFSWQHITAHLPPYALNELQEIVIADGESWAYKETADYPKADVASWLRSLPSTMHRINHILSRGTSKLRAQRFHKEHLIPELNY
ncbi:hypothetical protein GGR57DRAFT_499455 [Xylariaceae sp. FL1272]|nr:hypothetical protein GGR57DRAFT_499455 [Xylariaceae sp. FL1272]